MPICRWIRQASRLDFIHPRLCLFVDASMEAGSVEVEGNSDRWTIL